MTCCTTVQDVSVYTKHPSGLTMLLFTALRKRAKLHVDLLLEDWQGGLWQWGLFITWVLCTGLWDDVLSVLDDCYRAKEMSQFITLEQAFPWSGISRGNLRTELGAFRKVCRLRKFWKFFRIIDFSFSVFHSWNSSFQSFLTVCACVSNRDCRSLSAEDLLPVSVTADWPSLLGPPYALPGGLPLLCQHLQHRHQRP